MQKAFDAVKRSFNNFFLEKQFNQKQSSTLVDEYNKHPENLKPLSDFQISIDETIYVGKTMLDQKGFVYHHISSFDDFVENGIKQIITQIFRLDKDFTMIYNSDLIDRINVKVDFTDVQINKPKFNAFKKGISQPLMPNPALVNNKTYSAALYIDSKITATAYFKDGSTQVREQFIKKKKICQMPVMVGTKICNTYNLSDEALLRSKEDPSDLGAYFIIKGVEWVIDSIENITYNQARIYKNIGYQKEVVRCEYISKPGDSYQNSDQIIVRLSSNHRITVEIRRDKLKEKPIPFYLLFKAMGWTRELDIYNSIVYGKSGEISKLMSSILELAFIAKYDHFSGGLEIHDQIDAIRLMATYLADEGDRPLKYLSPMSKKENFHQATKMITRYFDSYLLPHIGQTTGSRNKKLRFLGLLIRKMLMVHLGINKPTDRDSLKNKRIHPSGISYAKAFKTYFNASIVQGIVRKIKNDFKNYPFEKVNLGSPIETQIYGPDFDKLIIQTITSGNKSQLKINRGRTITNRLSSQQLNRKNKLNAISILRQITTTNENSSKSSDRAREMRYVHPTYAGYIDPAHSPEGEKVGINKQLALFALITNASKSCVIKELIADFIIKMDCKDASAKCRIIENAPDDAIFEYENISHEEISRYQLNYVSVNGDPVGFTKSAISIADKFRKIRRGPNIGFDPMVTIHWNETEDECNFWTDPGRLTRPLMIVYNSQNDPEIFRRLGKGSTPLRHKKKTKKTKKKGGEESIYSGDESSSSDESADDVTPIHSSEATMKEGGAKKQDQKYAQSTLLNARIIDGLKKKLITFDDLLNWGVIEYISAEEQENMYLCPDIETLHHERHNELKNYTHVDIPQSIMGITTLTSPYANHNQTPRLTFQANQVRQTCGYYSLNWPYRVDKDTFLQYNCEFPLIRTLANKYVFPNGMNCMVAIAINGGYNQEDSILFSQGAIDRGVYNGCKFTFYQDVIDDGKEKFGVPDLSLTIHKNAGNYLRITKEGYIPRGSIVKKGDIIIGKYAMLPKGHDPHYKYQDKSTVYKGEEDAVVHNVIYNRNEEGKRFIKIALRKLRPIAVGDKFCLLPSAEVMTKSGWVTLEKLYEKYVDGDLPAICTLNQDTHAIEYRIPSEVNSFDHDGDMYSLKSQFINCESTLNHKMYTREKNGEYELDEVQDIMDTKRYWLRHGENTQSDIETFTIPEFTSTQNRRYPSLELNMNAWLKFFGIYIAEGCIDNAKSIRIYAHKQRVKDLIATVEEDLNLTRKVYTNKNCYYYSKIQMSEYLRQFGKSTSKYLPNWVYDLSEEQSQILVNAMLMGDGCKNKNSWEYYTGSAKLADCFQRLLIHCGWNTKISVKHEKGEVLSIKGVETTRSSDQLRMMVNKTKMSLEPLVGGKKTTEEIIQYTGKVMCPTVENNIFMVRCNNTTYWTSNSSRAGLVILAWGSW